MPEPEGVLADTGGGDPRVLGLGDGQRTALGDRFVKASPRRDRGADLTHLAPPMTPIETR